MSDLLLLAVAVILIVAVPFHVYVVWRYSRVVVTGDEAIASLNLTLLVVCCLAVAATMFALLGAQSITFLQTGLRLLPAPIPTLLIAVGAIAVSIPLPFELRQLRRWSQLTIEIRKHKRVGDTAVRPHNRRDDAP